MLTTGAITGGGNATNDYFDQEIDIINKPRRPLPSHQVEPHSAMLWAGLLYVVGIGISLPLGILMATFATTMAILAFLYSWKLKSSFLAGNLLVAFLSSMTVVYGGLTVGHLGSTLPSMFIIFVFMLCREVLKTAEDYVGDSARSIQTIAVLLGRSIAVRLFAGGVILVAGLLFWPWLIGQVTNLYFVFVLLGVVPFLLAAAVTLWFWPGQRQVYLVLRVTKLIFFIWLIAMLAG